MCQQCEPMGGQQVEVVEALPEVLCPRCGWAWTACVCWPVDDDVADKASEEAREREQASEEGEPPWTAAQAEWFSR